MSHAVLPPSSAEQWVNCPGWVEMTTWYPDDEDSEEAMIGTAVHELGAHLIKDDPTHAKPWAPQGVIYTDEMIECAKLYAGYCIGLIEQYPRSAYAIEQHVSMAKTIHPENSGTPDFMLVERESKTIHIVDYKNGRGVVEAYQNWQLLDYLYGVAEAHNLTIAELWGHQWSINLTIVQPRAFSGDGVIRTWTVPPAMIQVYADRLHTSAIESLSGNAMCHAGDHCRYCRALHACPTALQMGKLLFDLSGRATPVELSAHAMGLQYEVIKSAVKLLSSLEASYEAQITSKLRLGTNIPGWSLEGKIGNLEWTAPLEEVFAIGDLMGVDLRKTTEAITPSQAKSKGLDTSVLTEYASRPKKGFKLTKFDDSRISRIFNVQGGQNNG